MSLSVIPSRTYFGLFPLSEVPNNDRTIEALKNANHYAYDSIVQFNDICKEVEYNDNLSAKGQAKHKAAKTLKVLGEILAHNNSITYAKRELNGINKKILGFAPKPADPTDELRAQELRTYVRNLPDNKRTMFLMDCAKNLDYETISAVVAAPSFLSGTSRETQSMLKNQMLRESMPQEVERSNILSDCIESATTALIRARNMILGELDFRGVSDEGMIVENKETIPAVARKLGYTGCYKSEMTVEQKAAFISQYGSETYDRLPFQPGKTLMDLVLPDGDIPPEKPDGEPDPSEGTFLRAI